MPSPVSRYWPEPLAWRVDALPLPPGKGAALMVGLEAAMVSAERTMAGVTFIVERWIGFG